MSNAKSDDLLQLHNDTHSSVVPNAANRFQKEFRSTLMGSARYIRLIFFNKSSTFGKENAREYDEFFNNL
ncbi:MAG: hypothetical protein WD824_20340 [Cyclobacteriaceae bacterium]